MTKELQCFYILHTRAYRDTSLLLTCLTETEGLISLVAKGVKRPGSAMKAILQPFIPLIGHWQGRGEMQTLFQAERASNNMLIRGEKIFSGLYINELLTNVLHAHDPCPLVFEAYHMLLQACLTEKALRFFEKRLLTELGYGLDLRRDVTFSSEKSYYFHPEMGCLELEKHSAYRNTSQILFTGESLLAIAEDRLDSAVFLKDAKRLMRLAFEHLLQGKVLKSRLLYQHLKEIA